MRISSTLFGLLAAFALVNAAPAPLDERSNGISSTINGIQNGIADPGPVGGISSVLGGVPVVGDVLKAIERLLSNGLPQSTDGTVHVPRGLPSPEEFLVELKRGLEERLENGNFERGVEGNNGEELPVGGAAGLIKVVTDTLERLLNVPGVGGNGGIPRPLTRRQLGTGVVGNNGEKLPVGGAAGLIKVVTDTLERLLNVPGVGGNGGTHPSGIRIFKREDSGDVAKNLGISGETSPINVFWVGLYNLLKGITQGVPTEDEGTIFNPCGGKMEDCPETNKRDDSGLLSGDTNTVNVFWVGLYHLLKGITQGVPTEDEGTIFNPCGGKMEDCPQSAPA